MEDVAPNLYKRPFYKNTISPGLNALCKKKTLTNRSHRSRSTTRIEDLHLIETIFVGDNRTIKILIRIVFNFIKINVFVSSIAATTAAAGHLLASLCSRRVRFGFHSGAVVGSRPSP